MKRNLIIIFALILMVGLFTACSDNNTNKSASNDPANSNTEGVKEEVTLEIGLPGGYDVTAKEIIDGFTEEHPHINLKITEAPWGEYTQQIVTKIAGDTAPDLWFQENAVVLGYGERGVAEELTPYIENDADLNEDDYIDALFTTSTPDGEIYGIPHGINPIALGYNKKMFEDAGVDYPTDDWTYDDMIEAAKELTRDTDGDGKIDIYGFDLSWNITQGWYPWIRAGGGHILDETLTKARLTEPETIEAVKTWSSLMNDLKVSPTPEYKEASGGDTFANDIAAMSFLQYSQQINLNENFPDLDYDTVKIPKAFNGEDRYVTMVVNSWVMYSRSDQEVKDAAWEFLKYYLSEESQMILAESYSTLPIKKTALEEVDKLTETKPSNKKAFTEGIAESGVTSDENPTWNEWRGAAQTGFTDIITEVLTPEEALKEMEGKIQAILDEE